MWSRCLLLLAIGAGSAAADPSPRPAINGEVEIRADDLAPDSDTGLLRARVAFPPEPPRRRLLAAQPDETPEGRLLARLLAQGAAGNHGDLYDNRDRGHSRLPPSRWPTLTYVAYDEAAQARNLDYGLNLRLAFDAVTIGNSSTAIVRPTVGRSLPRAAMTTPGGAARLSQLYGANHLYVYPAHHDYRRGEDRLPATLPQIVVSEGSSRSDQRFLAAAASMLAAMRPDTKAFLREHGLVGPALQMMLRRGMNGVETDADYLSAKAHPAAFRGSAVDRARMIRRAAALRPDTAPPRVRLAMVEEPVFLPGVAIFGDGATEALFDTPDAIARVAIATPAERRYRLDVRDTVDPLGRPLSFEWRVIRGPGVTVRPLDPQGLEAEIVVPWTGRYLDPASALETRRIDVAAFAWNGAEYSAPAFFSLVFPPHEIREYAPDGRPLSIDYGLAAPGRVGRDPLLHVERRWRDEHLYGDDGAPLGWRRTHADGRQHRFDARGRRVIAEDLRGRPVVSRLVRYPVEAADAHRMAVRQQDDDWVVFHRYDGPEDMVGAPSLPAYMPASQ